MVDWGDTGTLAYCGWVCAACPGLKEGCAGCRAGGGDEGCQVRTCCLEHGYEGCWQCAEMPCDRGQFANVDYCGTTNAILRTVQRVGVGAALARVRARLGDLIDFGALSGKSVDEVLAILNQSPADSV